MSDEKTKILFVCMGNICRSPSAEGAFRSQVKKRDAHHLFEIDSAGTHAYHVGEQPDPRSQVSAAKHHVDLSNQRARQVHESDFIIMITSWQWMKQICPTCKIFALRISNLNCL